MGTQRSQPDVIGNFPSDDLADVLRSFWLKSHHINADLLHLLRQPAGHPLGDRKIVLNMSAAGVTDDGTE